MPPNELQIATKVPKRPNDVNSPGRLFNNYLDLVNLYITAKIVAIMKLKINTPVPSRIGGESGQETLKFHICTSMS